MSIWSEPLSPHPRTHDDSLQRCMEPPFSQFPLLTLYISPILEAKSDVLWCLPPQLSNVTTRLSPYSAAHKCFQTESRGPWGTIIWLPPCVSFLSTITDLLCLLSCTWNILSYSYLPCFMMVFVKKSNLVSFIQLWLKVGVPPYSNL